MSNTNAVLWSPKTNSGNQLIYSEKNLLVDPTNAVRGRPGRVFEPCCLQRVETSVKQSLKEPLNYDPPQLAYSVLPAAGGL